MFTLRMVNFLWKAWQNARTKNQDDVMIDDKNQAQVTNAKYWKRLIRSSFHLLLSAQNQKKSSGQNERTI